MGEDSRIEWTDHTFNPWTGCTKVSPGCDHCYAEGWAKRSGLVEWGPHGARRRTSEANWRQPLKWNRELIGTGETRFVFCASLADVFDNQAPAEWRDDLWALIRATPNLTWLLLTKRPQNIAKMLPADWASAEASYYRNVWLGTTVENQAEADRRIPALLSAQAARRFLSCEPLLGPLDLKRWLMVGPEGGPEYAYSHSSFINWIIAGGESGPGARPVNAEWVRSLRDQCERWHVDFFFKQWGGRTPKSGGKILDGQEHCFRPAA